MASGSSLPQLLDTLSASDTVSVPASWGQGRTLFGGLLAALAVRAASNQLPEPRPLRSLQMTFIAPAAPGDVQVQASVTRVGKNLSFAEAHVLSGGVRCASAALVFGSPRPSTLTVAPPRFSPSKPAEEGLVMPYIEGLTPRFLQNFEIRLTEGAVPFQGAKEPLIGGFVRLLEPATGPEALVAMVDAWPSPLLPMGTRPFPASTVQWSVHLRPGAAAAAGPYWYHYAAPVADDSFATAVGHLYAEGELIARSEQLQIVFA